MDEHLRAPGVLMLDLEGTTLTDFECDLLRRSSVGGIILFSRNYRSADQLRSLVSEIRKCRSELLIAVDQEGGRVQRFQEGFTRLPPVHKLGEYYLKDRLAAIELAKQCGWLMAAELLDFDIDISFAPVLDLYSAKSQVIADRAFSDSVDTVVDLASAYIEGMEAAGMGATGKHFPGHGSVVADSHVELPTDNRSADEIFSKDYQVFAKCINQLAGIMPAHVRYPAVDAECAGYSTVWLQDKLRGDLGFEGIIFSDDLSMVAAHTAGDIETRAEKALSAGCDMILVCNDRDAALAVSDWLENDGRCGNERIIALRGRAPTTKLPLRSSDQWLQARAAVELL